MIGRHEEISRLEEVLDAAADGVGRITMITGEAGSGKTLLLQEALGRCGGRIEGHMLSQPSGSEAFPLILWHRLLIQMGRATPAPTPSISDARRGNSSHV